jgi:uncharacterized membrane protein
VGGILLGGFVIYDLFDAPHAAQRANEKAGLTLALKKTNVALMPIVSRRNTSNILGLSLGLRF